MKRISLAISTLLVTLFTSMPVFAATVDASHPLVLFIKFLVKPIYVLAGLGLAFSVVAVVMAGFLYVYSGVDVRSLMMAKATMWRVGIGIFILLNIFVILHMFAGMAGVPL